MVIPGRGCAGDAPSWMDPAATARHRWQVYPGDRRKRHIQKEFQRKAAAAIRDRSVLATQDWTGVTAILKTILTAFD